MSLRIGLAAEEQALRYLQQQGLQRITENYRCRFGEVDLIMQEREVLVFVEVRKRTSRYFGRAIDSVTLSKRQKIIKTALFYLTEKHLQNKRCVRFDIICLDGQTAQISWIKNAFGVDY